MLILALLLAGLLGFTAHSAGICAVKAVSEVIATRRGYMLASFGKTVLWVMLGMGVLSWLLPGRLAPISLVPTALSLFGGFAFGIGAALNGGCAVSTVTRLGNGELRMLSTLLGMMLAIAAIENASFSHAPLAASQPAPALLGGLGVKLSLGVLLGGPFGKLQAYGAGATVLAGSWRDYSTAVGDFPWLRQ
jgi:uncharacterized membrane protein YedE/YeeE